VLPPLPQRHRCRSGGSSGSRLAAKQRAQPLVIFFYIYMWYAVQSNMAADSGMETCPSPDNPENKKRPWDGEAENGTTKRSHHGAGNLCTRKEYSVKYGSYAQT